MRARARQWAYGTPFLALALVVLLSNVPPERIWPVLALALIGVLLIVVPHRTWGRLLGKVESASFGPVSVNLREAVGKAAEQAPDEDEDQAPDSAGAGKENGEEKPSITVFDLRILLEAKLTYVAKHLLAPSEWSATFLSVGSLKTDGYLTEAEARTAIAILSLRQEELDLLPEQARNEFLEEASEFVGGVRATIFWGQVKRRLEGTDREAWRSLLRKEIPRKGKRKDLLAKSSKGPVRVAPVFATDADSKILDGAIRRLKGEGLAARGGERQIIVVPDRSRVAMRQGVDGEPDIVKLGRLRGKLEAA